MKPTLQLIRCRLPNEWVVHGNKLFKICGDELCITIVLLLLRHEEVPQTMLEPGIHLLEPQSKMCVADPADRKRWSKIAVTKLIRESGLSPTTVYKILKGEPVRRCVLSTFIQAVGNTPAARTYS